MPEKAPSALSSLLEKTQEGLNAGGGLDTVRWLHDSLAFLTEFFASFAVGALKTVGPYSAAVDSLLQQEPSLDRSERLLSQAFIDWKAHPHHPAYESLRETFYLTSRLQSSRFAPRRHTRWLGVEGRAVAGLERLTRWSRRIDLLVTGKDEEGAKGFVNIYTPVLWTWTDALEGFFKSWLVDLVTEVQDGHLSLSGSASKDDVRLDLVPLQQIAGLKCQFGFDGNGGVSVVGFNGSSVHLGPTSSESQEMAPQPEPTTQPPPISQDPVAAGESDLQLVFDPVSGNYMSQAPEVEPEFLAHPEPSDETPSFEVPADIDLSPDPEPEPEPEAESFSPPESPDTDLESEEVAATEAPLFTFATDEPRETPTASEEQEETVSPPSEAPLFSLPPPEEPVAENPPSFDFSTPAEVSEELAAPDPVDEDPVFETPSPAPEPPMEESVAASSASFDFSTPEVPEESTPPEPVEEAPLFSFSSPTPAPPAEEPVAQSPPSFDFSTPDLPEELPALEPVEEAPVFETPSPAEEPRAEEPAAEDPVAQSPPSFDFSTPSEIPEEVATPEPVEEAPLFEFPNPTPAPPVEDPGAQSPPSFDFSTPDLPEELPAPEPIDEAPVMEPPSPAPEDPVAQSPPSFDFSTPDLPEELPAPEPIDEAPVFEPPSPAPEPPAEEPPAEESPAEEKSAEEPQAEDAAASETPIPQPAVEAPVFDTPSPELPAEEPVDQSSPNFDFSAGAASFDFSQSREPEASVAPPDFTLPESSVDVPVEQTVEVAPPIEAPSLALPSFDPSSISSPTESFSVPSEPSTSVPDFSAAIPEPGQELAAEPEPEPEDSPPEFHSVEIETPAVAVREMGASAEEILEDEYEFSATEGPVRPQWSGWSVSQREAVQEVCEKLLASRESAMPNAFAEPIMAALNSPAPKIQIVMQPACGKTHLAQDLATSLGSSDTHLPLVASWESCDSDGMPGTEILKFYNELKQCKRHHNSSVVLPEPQAVCSLATSADEEGFSQAFQRLIGQLILINKKALLIIFDEPPKLVREALAFNPPEGVRFVTLLDAQYSQDSLGVAVDLQRRWKAASAELFGEQARVYFDHEGANLLRIALACELATQGGTVPESLNNVEEVVFAHSSVSSVLFAVLSLEEEAVSLDDLDQWFLEPQDVTAALGAFPSLFKLEQTRLSPLLSLAHESIAKFVKQTFKSERIRAARMILGWVVMQLERTGADKYGGLQVREIVFRNFLRLYKLAQLTEDPAIIEWVVRNKELQRRRVALTGHLERPGSRYELQELLQLLVELLLQLVDSGKCNDLRDELAWARSNLALNHLNLGLLPQARGDIVDACEMFETLVNQEKQYEFRPALSTTYYRVSRIYEAADDAETAIDYAKRAVQGFVDLVEDRGRSELAPRLGLALAHRGGLLYQAKDLAGAKADLQRASKLLESAGDEQNVHDSYRTVVEIQLELSSILTQEGDLNNAVLESGKAVQIATEAVEEKSIDEFQPLLATCHGVRAKAYFKLGEAERALRDIAKSISLRNLSVDEGRLEQRFHLAKDLQLRAQIDQSRGALDDASRDLARAVQLLETLSSEGRADAAPQLLKCLQDRARINLSSGDWKSGTEDLKRALALLKDDAAGAVEQRLSIMDNLLQAYLQAGNTTEALSISQGLLTHYHGAQQWEPYSRIQLVRGEAYEKSGNYAAALDSYNQAATLVSQLLAQGQTDELLGKVSEAYLGVGGAELKLGRAAASAAQVKKAIDVYLHLFQQRKKPEVLPKLLRAYSLFAAGNLASTRLAEAKQALKSGFDVLGYMESQGGQGGVPTARGLENLKGELHRQRAGVLLAEGDASNALNDAEEAIRNFLSTRQQGQAKAGSWKDELARTWILRSRILFALKDFANAEKSIQEAIAHFEECLRDGRYEYFPDLMAAFSVRAEHAARSGKIDLVLEEYNRMLAITTTAAKSGASIDHEFEMAKIFEKRAKVYRDQNLLNESYADYENVIGLYRNLVSTKNRAELATELVRVHIERGAMTTKAGHAQHAVTDFTEAVNVASALVGQGQVTAVPELATALHRRAEVFRSLGRGNEALQDLEGCIGFRLQLAQSAQEPGLMGELGKALLLQGTLLISAGQPALAAASLDKANAFFTNLVEVQGRQEYSSELAQSLIQRVSLSNDKSDPALREVLIKAVNLVNQQAKDGKPVAKDFAIECLRTVVELLQREDFETVGNLIDSVLALVETVVTDGRSEQDFVKLTDLLLAASAGLIDDRRTARRPHFLSLACVSCNREIQMFGKNSLPRLVYCLYELGQALERSKAPAVLNYVGSSFALLGELASQQQTNEDFLRELKMMVSTWRSLPPQIPALANVSRHMLSQLLRLT